MAGARVPFNRKVLDTAIRRIEAAKDLNSELTLRPEEAAQLWLWIRMEEYRHKRR